MNPHRRRRSIVGGLAVVGALLATRVVLYAHATLLSAEPAAGSVLKQPPERIRLLFSEQVDPPVSTIVVAAADSSTTPLKVAGDPHNVAALIAPLPHLPDGAYRVKWRTVSADGHPVSGSFGFSIRTSATIGSATGSVPAAKPTAPAAAPVEAPVSVPFIPALLRGLATGTLMAFAGLLFFSLGERESPAATRQVRLLGSLALALVAIQIIAWTVTTEVHHRLDYRWVQSMLGTTQGQVELARLAAVAVSLWALFLARRRSIALAFAGVALAISGGIGHPAAMTSIITVPAKSIHLLAGAAWLGGLQWLVLGDGDDLVFFATQARRVSKVALWCVGLVALSGVFQARFFLGSWGDLFGTLYGKLLIAKITGLLVLVAFGARNRFRIMPTDDAPAMASRLRGSVRQEIYVFALIILLGSLLSYLPPRPTDTAVAQTELKTP